MSRTPCSLIRRASSFNADDKTKTSRLKARCFKLPMSNPIKEPLLQHNSPDNQAELLRNYQRLQFPSSMETQRTNNTLSSRIPTREAPQPDRPMYTQITGRQQEDQSFGNRSSRHNMLVQQGKSSYSFANSKYILILTI